MSVWVLHFFLGRGRLRSRDGGGGIIARWQEFPCLPLFFLKTFFYPSPSSGSPLNPAPLPSLRALSLRGLADLHNGGKGIFALKIFFSIISRAFYYCLTCHADVKYPELIRECECSRGTMMQYLIALHVSSSHCSNVVLNKTMVLPWSMLTYV